MTMASRLQTFGIFCFLIVLFLIQVITTKQLKNIKSSMTGNGRTFNRASAQIGWRKRIIEETIEADNLIANQPPHGQPAPNVPGPKSVSSNAQDGIECAWNNQLQSTALLGLVILLMIYTRTLYKYFQIDRFLRQLVFAAPPKATTTPRPPMEGPKEHWYLPLLIVIPFLLCFGCCAFCGMYCLFSDTESTDDTLSKHAATLPIRKPSSKKQISTSPNSQTSTYAKV